MFLISSQYEKYQIVKSFLREVMFLSFLFIDKKIYVLGDPCFSMEVNAIFAMKQIKKRLKRKIRIFSL